MCLKGLGPFSQIVSHEALAGGEDAHGLNCSFRVQSGTPTGPCSHHEVEKKIIFYDSQLSWSTENPFLQTEVRADLPLSLLDRETQ